MGSAAGNDGRMTGKSNKKNTAPAVTPVPGRYIDQSLCTFCAGCSSVCPVMAIEVRGSSSVITDTCIDCDNCAAFCPVSAIRQTGKEDR